MNGLPRIGLFVGEWGSQNMVEVSKGIKSEQAGNPSWHSISPSLLLASREELFSLQLFTKDSGFRAFIISKWSSHTVSTKASSTQAQARRYWQFPSLPAFPFPQWSFRPRDGLLFEIRDSLQSCSLSFPWKSTRRKSIRSSHLISFLLTSFLPFFLLSQHSLLPLQLRINFHQNCKPKNYVLFCIWLRWSSSLLMAEVWV